MRFWLLFSLLIVLATAAALFYLVRNPTKLLEVNDRVVATTLERALPEERAPEPECGQRGERYLCTISDRRGDPITAYRIGVGDDGCWRARAVGPERSGLPRRLSDCISLGDALRVDFL